MDEDKKQKIMIGAIVGCLIIAGAIFFVSKGGGKPKKVAAKPVLMVCANKSCKASYELSSEEYRQEMQGDSQGMDPMMMSMMGPIMLKCNDCGKKSLSVGEKCEKCETVFPSGTVKKDYPDRCPKCKYSKIEELRKSRRK